MPSMQKSNIQRGVWRLMIQLRTHAGASVLGSEPVIESDLADVTSELWMRGILRGGNPDVALDDVHPRVVPLFPDTEGEAVIGYRLEADCRGKTSDLLFTTASLEPVATRASRRMIAEGLVSPGASVRREVIARCSEAGEIHPEAPPEQMIVHEIPRPLQYLRLPMEIAQAQVGSEQQRCDRDYPVFYAADALLDAAQHSQRGATFAEPVETGAALVGTLCSCPVTGEFYAIVMAAIPIEAASQTRFSLELSPESWQRIDQGVDELRARYGTMAIRLLGQAHGHPFAPGVQNADGSGEAFSGSLPHSAYVSADDIAWSRGVFAGEPWQLSHIFGMDRKGGEVHSLFGLRDGTLARRGFAVIPRFLPEWIDVSQAVTR